MKSKATQGARAGFLLAGGKSSRMGTNKAFLDFGRHTLLERALGVLKEACSVVTIVGDPAIFARFGPAVADVFPDCGPLGGIHAALLGSSVEFNFILAVDLPFVSAELVKFLLGAAEDSRAIVTIPRTRAGLQPLCAVYRREFASAAEQALGAGNYKVDAAFANVRRRVIEERELVAAGFSESNFLNINTPQDLGESARRLKL